MKTTRKMTNLAATLIIFGSLFGGANAAVFLTFDDSSGSVVATWSGSLNLTGATLHVNDFDQVADELVATNSSMYVRVTGTPSFDQYHQGTGSGSLGFLSAPSSHTMLQTFGYSSKFVMLDYSTPINGVVNPTGTMTWAGQTLSDIGLSWLSTTPTTVYSTTGNNDSIQFVAVAVPEPSSIFLFGLSSLSFALRRRRR